MKTLEAQLTKADKADETAGSVEKPFISKYEAFFVIIALILFALITVVITL